MKILVLNSGSSSQKSALYEIGDTVPEDAPEPLWRAKIEWGNGADSTLTVKTASGSRIEEHPRVNTRAEAVEHMLNTMCDGDCRVLNTLGEVSVVGHRVVHGGSDYEQPVVITEQVKDAIGRLSVFAPLHNRAELEGIELIEELVGSVKQVAVFDTGYHRQMPLTSVVYPGPYEWYEHGIRRYGFHGINHQYCAERAAKMLGRPLNSLRLVTCHLGNGCSLAAIRDGRSVDTTMGFTPLDGLMMGTRSGAVDPSIPIFLLRQRNLSLEQVDHMLNSESGLLGVSGVSEDMRQVMAAVANGNARAKLAVDIYIQRLTAYLGAMIAVLGGVDAIVFTAGVGENSPEVRLRSCAQLAFAGIALDAEKNCAHATGDRDIAADSSTVRVLVIAAQEDWAIARDCWNLARRPD